MNKTFKTALTLRLAALLGSSAFFAASPVTLQLDGISGLPQVALLAAFADDNGGSGGGDDDHGGDDHGGDDHGDDHDSGDDDSGDDDSSDDDGSDDSSDDNSTDGSSSGGNAGQVVKIETSANGIEVTYGDGSKEEIEGGRYERKDSSGKTIEERPATQADFDRLSALF